MFLSYLGVWLIIPLALVVYYFGKHIHRNEFRYYFGVLIISIVLTILVLFSLDTWIFQSLVIEGHLSFALFVIVMYGGALPFKSKMKKYLMQIRREFALIGFLLLIPHGMYRISLALNGYNFTGLWAFILMIPLVIVSYPHVRKKIRRVTWTRIHKAAYVVYLFIYIHVGFRLFINGSFRQFSIQLDAWPYHALFIGYLVLKIRVVIINRRKIAVS
ncbi:MAG: hypothetical protein ACVCEJ_08235 [Candidatus Izemoplasmataceae bacterium]